MIYHVSTSGSDLAKGTLEAPFKTLNHAAQIAIAGDTVVIHGGTYREWVDPKNGGKSEHSRIIYKAADGEHPIIKGSEIICDWENYKDTVWKKVIPNSFFGDWNPYALAVEGDWLCAPKQDYKVHLGDVYINGVSTFEAKSFEDLFDNTPRTVCFQNAWRVADELILHPELTVYKWYAVVDTENTTIYCNFREYNPNNELIEINVRPCCFYPSRTGIDYVTVSGIEFCQAACPWTPPTSHQIGMVGPHWAKKWIIENCHLHDAKCSAISLGKEESTGHNLFSRFKQKSGHRHQLEAVFAAHKIGWSKESIGSHIVRNNVIHDCGQNGIVGHLGCIFSTIEHNHIYNIGVKHEFWGHEMAGIKFHGAIDTLIIGNNIHNCTLGTWLDWQAQGMRVTRNVYNQNNRDFMIEVSHGPTLVDHNIFMSEYALDNWSQGGAFVHNLFAGKTRNHAILNRSTPYHLPHSTDILGYTEVLGGDDRYYNNLFIGKFADGGECLEQFTKNCDKFSDPDEYWNIILSKLQDGHDEFTNTPQPVYIKDNAYSGYASPSKHEKNGFILPKIEADLKEVEGKVVLTLDLPSEILNAECEALSSARLGRTRISDGVFEAPDGSDYDFSFDMIGQSYGQTLLVGPIATIKAGKQEITVWQ